MPTSQSPSLTQPTSQSSSLTPPTSQSSSLTPPTSQSSSLSQPTSQSSSLTQSTSQSASASRHDQRDKPANAKPNFIWTKLRNAALRSKQVTCFLRPVNQYGYIRATNGTGEIQNREAARLRIQLCMPVSSG